MGRVAFGLGEASITRLISVEIDRGGYMKYTRKAWVLLFAIFLILSSLVVTVSAQNRRSVRRPVIIRHYGWHDPWFSRNWWWNDPYWSDPYLREQREAYYKNKAVKDANKKLNKDKEKFRADGVITAKEQEKLDKRARDYSKAVEKLDKFNRDSSE
jgi:hypothetical protein